MNEYLAMALDGGFNDHWPDILVSAFIACVGWLLKRDISGMDKRHERAENKFSEHDKTLGEHETRIAIIEDRTGKVDERYR